MRGFTFFFAAVVVLTWALTVVHADPEPVRIRNPFRGPADDDVSANVVPVRAQRKVDNVAKPTVRTLQDAPKRRRGFYSQVTKQLSKSISSEATTEEKTLALGGRFKRA